MPNRQWDDSKALTLSAVAEDHLRSMHRDGYRPSPEFDRELPALLDARADAIEEHDLAALAAALKSLIWGAEADRDHQSGNGRGGAHSGSQVARTAR